jgi:heterodisulfide reductase subunit A
MQEEMDLTPDLVALSVGIVADGTEDLSKLLKAPLTSDNFFLEAPTSSREL